VTGSALVAGTGAALTPARVAGAAVDEALGRAAVEAVGRAARAAVEAVGRATGAALAGAADGETTGFGVVVPANAAADKPPPTTTAATPKPMTRARVDLSMDSPAGKRGTLSQGETPEEQEGWLRRCDPAHN
jgi:hypothetical protein